MGRTGAGDDAALDALLASALSGSAPDVRALAAAQGMTVVGWADALRGSDALGTLAFLAHVVDRAAGLGAALARAEAVRALARLAGEEGGGETARKACVDVLSLRHGEDGALARGASREGGRAPGRGAALGGRSLTPGDADALSALDARILGALDQIHACHAPAGAAPEEPAGEAGGA